MDKIKENDIVYRIVHTHGEDMTNEIIRSVRLICDSQGSNKVINMHLIKVDEGYRMDYETGPNGGTLVPRTKTPNPVSLSDAEKEWDKLFKSKVKPNEYRVDAIDRIEQTYTQPIQSKISSGKSTMLLGEVQNDNQRLQLINDPDWIVEEKFDGTFLKVIVENGDVTGSNKKGIVTNVPSHLKVQLQSKKRNFEVDGELVGRYYYIFELPSVDNNPPLPTLEQRKLKLESLGLANENIHVIKLHDASAEAKIAKIEEIKNRRGEGIVFKMKDAPYEPGISRNVLKDKFKASATFVVLSQNIGVDSVKIGAFDEYGVMQELNSVSKASRDIPDGSIIEVEYLYANPATNALQQPVFKCLRPEQDINDCVISQLKYKNPLDHGLFFSVAQKDGAETINSTQIVHGYWTHIFHENGPDISLRFAFDRSIGKIVAMQIQNKSEWKNASENEIADVQESLITANDDAISSPDDWGLELSDSLPEWVDVTPARKFKM